MRVHSLSILPDDGQNNLVFILENDRREAVIVDPGEAKPVSDFLRQQNLKAAGILVTHRHGDHIGGVPDLLTEFPNLPVWASRHDHSRLPFSTQSLSEGAPLGIAGFRFEIWETPGHLDGQIAYIEHSQKWIFSGDLIFGLGCGRIFNGTALELQTSLLRLRDLPSGFSVFCTHDYASKNLPFVEAQGFPTPSNVPGVPLNLDDEKKWNPFLQPMSPEKFAALRQLRNQFPS